ncbi:related to polyhydroxybutyrate depolymerase [Cephalotrichum gorgonifer]|uniref:Related to polyhydroxybutyrate depolymerase n=1 Tax=Cephalotrichum gorgonifer TaxID=2041049 RepID=A0AAE8MTN3_9PEZI|nr:related to polyhydroxybutyrate depolymerase [Cephalotrichum gorgonifer]
MMVNTSLCLGLLGLASPGALGAPLGAYNVDANSVSVSGLSSGGFMSAHLGIAYSDTFKTGFGVFAGGPYDCARNQLYGYLSCMSNLFPLISVPTANMKAWSGTKIDSVSNFKSRRVYMQVGSADTTVGPNVMSQLRTQLSGFVDSSKVAYVTTQGAAHVFPTDFDGPGNNACGSSSSPYIANCAYDGAGAVLKQMYGPLAARNAGAPTGSVVSFDQTGKYGAGGMDGTGYLYVPAACRDGSTVCKLHVALHGCSQSKGHIGTKFVENSGYNKWADTNNIIILYPQATVDLTLHLVWSLNWLPNPNGCWDWIGWYGANADQKGGAQMVAIVNQVNQILSG